MKRKKAEPAPLKREYTAEELSAMPTIEGGHFGDVKVLTEDYSVVLMRIGAEDDYCWPPVAYQALVDGKWVDADSEGRPIPEIIQSVGVLGRRWFRSGPGNTIHSVTIVVNGVAVARLRGNGGESVFEQTAAAWLWRNGYFQPEKPPCGAIAIHRLVPDNVRLYGEVVDVQRERDL